MQRKLLKFKDYLITTLAYYIVYFICRTLRVNSYFDESLFKYYKDGKNVIFAFWHRRLFYLAYYHKKRFPEKRVCVLVSKSRDGTMVGKVVKKIGVDYVQGSTSRGGAAGFKQLLQILQEGASAAITPDGPRGPRGVVQKGVISLARISKKPIIPICYHVNRFFMLKSWDKFIIPIPFSKVDIITGNPIIIESSTGHDDSFYERIIKDELDRLEDMRIQ